MVFYSFVGVMCAVVSLFLVPPGALCAGQSITVGDPAATRVSDELNPPESCMMWDPPPGGPIPIEYADWGDTGGGGGLCTSCATYFNFLVKAVVCCSGVYCDTLRFNGWSVSDLGYTACEVRSNGVDAWCFAYGNQC